MWRYRSASKGQGVQFQMGEEVVAPGKDKQEQKDSKTCSIMWNCVCPTHSLPVVFSSICLCMIPCAWLTLLSLWLSVSVWLWVSNFLSLCDSLCLSDLLSMWVHVSWWLPVSLWFLVSVWIPMSMTPRVFVTHCTYVTPCFCSTPCFSKTPCVWFLSPLFTLRWLCLMTGQKHN